MIGTGANIVLRPIWKIMAEESQAKASARLRDMLKSRLETNGVEFGSFTVAWMDDVLGCDRRVMLRRSGMKVHVTRDIGWSEEGRIIDVLEEAVVEHLKTRATLARYVGSVWHSMRTLLPHLGERPVLADHVSRGSRTYIAYARLLGHGMTERMRPLHMHLGGSEAEKALERVVATQRMRLARLTAGGSREGALTCCPVAAALIMSDHSRRDKAIANLRDAMRGSTTTFVDGHYSPSVALGRGVTWRNGRMKLRVGTLPHTMHPLLVGRPLADVVGHPWLPEGTVEYADVGQGDLVLRATFEPVPLVPVLKAAGMTLDHVL